MTRAALRATGSNGLLHGSHRATGRHGVARRPPLTRYGDLSVARHTMHQTRRAPDETHSALYATRNTSDVWHEAAFAARKHEPFHARRSAMDAPAIKSCVLNENASPAHE